MIRYFLVLAVLGGSLLVADMVLGFVAASEVPGPHAGAAERGTAGLGRAHLHHERRVAGNAIVRERRSPFLENDRPDKRERRQLERLRRNRL